MTDIRAVALETYRQEAAEHLSILENALLELEQCPTDLDTVGLMFRALHTIKGSGAMFGFTAISQFTHEVESVMDLVRNGKMAVTPELVSIGLEIKDVIREMVDLACMGDSAEVGRAQGVLVALRKLVDMTAPKDMTRQQVGPISATRAAVASQEATYRIRFNPHPEFLATGTKPENLVNELRELGNCIVVANTWAIPDIEEMNAEQCYIGWDVILTTDKGIDAIKGVFMFVMDVTELRIDVIDCEGIHCENDDYRRLGEILVERGDVAKEDLEAALGKKKYIGEMLVDEGLVNRGHVEAALIEQKKVQEIRKDRQTKAEASTIRVPSDKLDVLVDLVGELVTVQANLGQITTGWDSLDYISDNTEIMERLSRNNFKLLSDLSFISEAVGRLTSELRDNTMSLRMLPIGTTFSKFRRVIRDLSAELGREIDLTTEGDDTELDKTMIEHLNDPLMHLIRNSVDHGVELPGERERTGKPRKGTIHLSAVHAGSEVFIQVRDDGKGLNSAAIRNKAIEKGLIAPDAAIDDSELFQLIFAPGFSTAERVTGVSGRGVGMDVVKKSIEALRGEISIDSVQGKGTTITLKIPLTLAIIEGLMIKLSGQSYVLPLSMVEECVELIGAEQEMISRNHIIEVRGHAVPYIRLREFFSLNGGRPEIEQIVITSVNGARVGFVVDDVVGEHQTVIKSLGNMYKNIEGVSGATIQGDGTIALILDLPKIYAGMERFAAA